MFTILILHTPIVIYKVYLIQTNLQLQR